MSRKNWWQPRGAPSLAVFTVAGILSKSAEETPRNTATARHSLCVNNLAQIPLDWKTKDGTFRDAACCRRREAPFPIFPIPILAKPSRTSSPNSKQASLQNARGSCKQKYNWRRVCALRACCGSMFTSKQGSKQARKQASKQIPRCACVAQTISWVWDCIGVQPLLSC